MLSDVVHACRAEVVLPARRSAFPRLSSVEASPLEVAVDALECERLLGQVDCPVQVAEVAVDGSQVVQQPGLAEREVSAEADRQAQRGAVAGSLVPSETLIGQREARESQHLALRFAELAGEDKCLITAVDRPVDVAEDKVAVVHRGPPASRRS